MKTREEIEAAVCAGISRFEQEYRGGGPNQIHAYLLAAALIVSMEPALDAASLLLLASRASARLIAH
jgi:uncharacterized protein YbcI